MEHLRCPPDGYRHKKDHAAPQSTLFAGGSRKALLASRGWWERAEKPNPDMAARENTSLSTNSRTGRVTRYEILGRSTGETSHPPGNGEVPDRTWGLWQNLLHPAGISEECREGGWIHPLPLLNNDQHIFCVSDINSMVMDIAKEQGASFIFECLKILLESPGKKGLHEVPCNKHPEPTQDTLTTSMLNNIAGPDQRLRILLHLDEHRKMSQWEVDNLGDEAIKWAMFRMGAMEALANVPRVTVVATYTARPPLPAQASSAVC